jgi:hypothetical protein
MQNFVSGKHLGLYQIKRSVSEILTGCVVMISKRFEVIFIFFFNKPTALQFFKRVSEKKTPD